MAAAVSVQSNYLVVVVNLTHNCYLDVREIIVCRGKGARRANRSGHRSCISPSVHIIIVLVLVSGKLERRKNYLLKVQVRPRAIQKESFQPNLRLFYLFKNRRISQDFLIIIANGRYIFVFSSTTVRFSRQDPGLDERGQDAVGRRQEVFQLGRQGGDLENFLLGRFRALV